MNIEGSILTVLNTSIMSVSISMIKSFIFKEKVNIVEIEVNDLSLERINKLFEVQELLTKEILKSSEVTSKTVIFSTNAKRGLNIDNVKLLKRQRNNKKLLLRKMKNVESFKLISEITDVNNTFGIIESVASIISISSGLKRIAIQILNNRTKDEGKLGLVISTLYLNEKLKRLIKGFYISLIGLVTFGVLSIINSNFILPLIILSLIQLLMLTYQWVLKFRIENGLFGSNYYEAKQLLTFITNNEDKFDSGRKVFNSENLDEIFIELGKGCNNREVKHGV